MKVRKDDTLRLGWRSWQKLHYSGDRPTHVEFDRWRNHIEIDIGVDAYAEVGEWRQVLRVLANAVRGDIIEVDTDSVHDSIEFRPVRFGGIQIRVSEHTRGSSKVTVSRRKLMSVIAQAVNRQFTEDD